MKLEFSVLLTCSIPKVVFNQPYRHVKERELHEGQCFAYLPVRTELGKLTLDVKHDYPARDVLNMGSKGHHNVGLVLREIKPGTLELCGLHTWINQETNRRTSHVSSLRRMLTATLRYGLDMKALEIFEIEAATTDTVL